MSKNSSIWLVFIASFLMTSCGQKFYYKNDYSFYRKGFFLDESTLLRTDGFYIRESEWDNRDGCLAKLEKCEAYIFYKTGQMNIMLMDTQRGYDESLECIQHQIHDNYGRKTKSTLFQGYYKIKNKKIITQQVNVPLRQFYYLYGSLEKDRLIIFKKTISGNGEFREDYFAGIHNETYMFVPLNAPDNVIPNW